MVDAAWDSIMSMCMCASANNVYKYMNIYVHAHEQTFVLQACFKQEMEQQEPERRQGES